MKKLMIARSDLTNPPRYYAFRNFKLRGNGTLVVTGQKEDITEQIEEIIKHKLLDQKEAAKT